MRPHRQQPTRLPHPWDSPGKNTAVGCHFLLQRMKVKSESEVAQSCQTLSDPMDYSLPGSSIHGIFQARALEWLPLPSPARWLYDGANGDLLQDGLCSMLCDPGLLQPEPLPPWQATADPGLCRRHSNTQRQLRLSFSGVSGSRCTQGLFEPS